MASTAFRSCLAASLPRAGGGASRATESTCPGLRYGAAAGIAVAGAGEAVAGACARPGALKYSPKQTSHPAYRRPARRWFMFASSAKDLSRLSSMVYGLRDYTTRGRRHDDTALRH